MQICSVRYRWNLGGGSEVEAIRVMYQFYSLGPTVVEAFVFAELVSAEMLTIRDYID